PEGLEQLRVTVLRRKLHELIKRMNECQRIMADEMQLLPEPIEVGLLFRIEHQPAQRLILAMEQGQRDGLVYRHDLRVTQRGGEPAAKIIERPFPALARLAGLADEDRHVGTQPGRQVRLARLEL